MKFLIAPDKFKGSLSAAEVAQQIAAGIRDVLPDGVLDIAPIADGGEGTADVICRARGGEWITCEAHDPFGRRIEARYVWLRESEAAVIEMSEAAGMRRTPYRDVLRATTFGVGEMIVDASRRGAREIIIGLGGSATNDGGVGMARALGFRFFGGDYELTDGPAELGSLTRILPPDQLHLPKIVAVADVQNPLTGERGAARMFSPQKGATAEQVELLDRALARLASVAARDLGCDHRAAASAGAAGGLGFGLATFCGAELRSGFDLIAEAVDLPRRIAHADVVITGEGRLDSQTLEGKAPARVAELARAAGKRVFAIVGQAAGANELFDAVFQLAGRSPRETARQLTSGL